MRTAEITTLDHIKDNIIRFLLVNGCKEEDVDKFINDTYGEDVSYYVFDSQDNFRLILSMLIGGKYKADNIKTPMNVMSKKMENKFVYISGNINFTYRNFIIPEPKPGSTVIMFPESEMKYDVLDHFLQPDVRIFRRGTHDQFFIDYKNDVDNFSQVQVTDPVARRLLANVGDVIEYSTYSKASGKKEFRVVIPQWRDNL